MFFLLNLVKQDRHFIFASGFNRMKQWV